MDLIPRMRRLFGSVGNTLLERVGYHMSRVEVGGVDDHTSTQLWERFRAFSRIPGMLSRANATKLYFLAYGSSIRGDIIEIGSWQGRSTCFLAQACKDSGNGHVHAIDHFRGNKGKEALYRVGPDDLSDLQENFESNIQAAGLEEYVSLYAMDAGAALPLVSAAADRVRLLFIDGDHSYEGVAGDIRRFAPLLAPGGCMVLDDYSPFFPGCIQAVREWVLSDEGFEAPVQFAGTLIVRRSQDGPT